VIREGDERENGPLLYDQMTLGAFCVLGTRGEKGLVKVEDYGGLSRFRFGAGLGLLQCQSRESRW